MKRIFKIIFLIFIILISMDLINVQFDVTRKSYAIDSTASRNTSETLDYSYDLLKFIKDNNLLFSWDNNYNVGLIRKENIVVSFQPDLPFILINFELQRFTEPVLFERGKFYVTQHFIALLTKILIDNKEIAEQLEHTKKTENFQSPQNNVDNTSVEQNTDEKELARKTNQFSRIVTLVIDPGHGSKDPGAVGRFVYNKKSYRLMEKDVVLDISKSIRDKIRKLYPNLNVVMTRSKDEFISLEERTSIANKYLDRLKDGEGMIFLSVHANAALTSKASGYEVWYLPPDYRRNDLLSKEFNHSQIYSIINNLREEEIILESIGLANLVIQGLNKQVGSKSINRGIKEEKFYVVRNTKMPAVLVEVGFVTNPEEGYNLTREEYKEKVSEGITEGLHEYLKLFQ